MVVDTTAPATILGRFDTEDEAGIHLLNVALFNGPPGPERDAFLRSAIEFGIRVERKHLVVPRAGVATIAPLGEVDA